MRTASYIGKLRSAGIAADHAQAMGEALEETIVGDVASKADLAEVKAALKADIAEVRAELKGDIAEVKNELGALETRLIKYMIVQAISIIGLVLAIGGFAVRFLGPAAK